MGKCLPESHLHLLWFKKNSSLTASYSCLSVHIVVECFMGWSGHFFNGLQTANNEIPAGKRHFRGQQRLPNS